VVLVPSFYVDAPWGNTVALHACLKMRCEPLVDPRVSQEIENELR
jgi:hypothetical protein